MGRLPGIGEMLRVGRLLGGASRRRRHDQRQMQHGILLGERYRNELGFLSALQQGIRLVPRRRSRTTTATAWRRCAGVESRTYAAPQSDGTCVDATRADDRNAGGGLPRGRFARTTANSRTSVAAAVGVITTARVRLASTACRPPTTGSLMTSPISGGSTARGSGTSPPSDKSVRHG